MKKDDYVVINVNEVERGRNPIYAVAKILWIDDTKLAAQWHDEEKVDFYPVASRYIIGTISKNMVSKIPSNGYINESDIEKYTGMRVAQ